MATALLGVGVSAVGGDKRTAVGSMRAVGGVTVASAPSRAVSSDDIRIYKEIGAFDLTRGNLKTMLTTGKVFIQYKTMYV